MVEQERALQYYSDRNMKVSAGRWFGKPSLPSAPSLRPSSPDSEDWEELPSPSPHTTWGYSSHALVASARYTSPTSPFGNSSGYQSDLSLSFCSSVIPQRQALTVHSLNFSRPSSRKPYSLPPTPRLPPTGKQPLATQSLPPTPGPSNTQLSHTPTCPCHFRASPSQSQFTGDGCCDQCKSSCRLALDMQNL